MLKYFSKEKFDIIIQAGQSNSDGTGFGDASAPYIPKDTVWYLNADMTISIAEERVNGNLIQSNYSLAFADEYINSGLLKDGRKLLILRTSIGGTGFLDKRWGLSDDLYLHMIEMTQTALDLNPENRLVAFLWHQGETDALLNASYETHYGNLSTLIKTVREKFNCPDLPFVAGDFVQQWIEQNSAICKPVISAMRDVCRDLNNAEFVETDGLLSNSQKLGWDDTIHFCRDSLYELGRRYFYAFKKF